MENEVQALTLPGQTMVSSWDPTGAGQSAGGWLQDWHLGSVSSDYWEHTGAIGNSLHLPAGIPLANRSTGRRHGPSNTVEKSVLIGALVEREEPHLLWCAQDLANLKYGVHFAGAWEKRPEGIKLCHDAANCPLVYG